MLILYSISFSGDSGGEKLGGWAGPRLTRFKRFAVASAHKLGPGGVLHGC